MAEPDICVVCGLAGTAEHPLLSCGGEHETDRICVEALRQAMLKQREAAQNLAFHVSTQFLAVLEELAAHPDCMARPFVVWTPAPEQKQLAMPPQQVAGVFTAILTKFREMGNWSPLREAEERRDEYRKIATRALELAGAELDVEEAAELRAFRVQLGL